MSKIRSKTFLLIPSLLLSFYGTLDAMKGKSEVVSNELFSKIRNKLSYKEFIDNEVKLGNVCDNMKYNTLLHLDEFLYSLEVILSSHDIENVKVILASLRKSKLSTGKIHTTEQSILKSDKIEMRIVSVNKIIINFYRANDDYLSFVKVYAKRKIEDSKIFWELFPFRVCNRIRK